MATTDDLTEIQPLQAFRDKFTIETLNGCLYLACAPIADGGSCHDLIVIEADEIDILIEALGRAKALLNAEQPK